MVKNLQIPLICSASILLTAMAAPGNAQQVELVPQPPEYVLSPTAGSRTLMAAPAAQAGGVANETDVRVEMDIEMLARDIYNPETGKQDKVLLRGYVDPRAPAKPGPDAPIAGPSLIASPGQTIRVTLNNKLDPDPSCDMGGGGSTNIPHCFNATNLHSHGLWINPSGNGDNVLLSIRPGVSFEYEYSIPPEHPAGTFWYHPHLHGSTALQVSSGMGGALIVRGDREPRLDDQGSISGPGDLDRLIRGADGAPAAEKLLLLQQIQYACRDKSGKIQTRPDGAYYCDDGQVGGITGYDQFGPRSWPTSRRHTSINGAVLGKLADVVTGSVERWRFIHAGVRDTINIEIRHKSGDAPITAAAGSENWVDQNCGAAIPFHVVAQDGLTMAAAQPRMQSVLQPGYRVDMLVAFPEPGDYCIIDTQMPADGTVNQQAPDRRLLGLVTATGEVVAAAGSDDFLRDWLLAGAARNLSGAVRQRVEDDLRDGLKLTAFVPHPDIEDREVTGTQTLTFNIYTKEPGATFFQIDGKPYDGNRIDRVLQLGTVDEWTLNSDLASHPFHIHVNPFQVISILDPSGKEVSTTGAEDGGDPQYAGLKGVWKDTLWVKNGGGRYTITIRTRYQRYVGDFVLHCHILDHEDQGMMQNIRIALPDGTGGTAPAHH